MASSHWCPVRPMNARPPQVKDLQEHSAPCGPLWIRVLASYRKARTGPSHNGNADAAMVPGPDTIGPRHEHRHPEAAGHCTNHREDARSATAMLWARGQK